VVALQILGLGLLVVGISMAIMAATSRNRRESHSRFAASWTSTGTAIALFAVTVPGWWSRALCVAMALFCARRVRGEYQQWVATQRDPQ
jgi:hypothetical protein